MVARAASDLEPGERFEGGDDGPEVSCGDVLVVVEGLDGVLGEDMVDPGEICEQTPAVFGLQTVELDILVGDPDQVCLLPKRDRRVVAQGTNLLGATLPVAALALCDHAFTRRGG